MKSLLYDGLTTAIREIRNEKKLTQAEAAHRGDVHESSWCEWERGRQPGPDKLPKILRGLGCTEIELWKRKVQLEAKRYRLLPDFQEEVP